MACRIGEACGYTFGVLAAARGQRRKNCTSPELKLLEHGKTTVYIFKNIKSVYTQSGRLPQAMCLLC